MGSESITIPVRSISDAIKRGIHLVITDDDRYGSLTPILTSLTCTRNERYANHKVTLPISVLNMLTTQFLNYMYSQARDTNTGVIQQAIYSKNDNTFQIGHPDFKVVRNQMNCSNRPGALPAPHACANCYFGPFIAQQFPQRSKYFNSNAGLSSEGCLVAKQLLAEQLPQVERLHQLTGQRDVIEP